MVFDIKNADLFADCLSEQIVILTSAQERLERVCKFLKKSEEKNAAIRTQKQFDNLSESISAAKRLLRAVRRIISNYSGCEKRIEERYDSLWHIEKIALPELLDLSAMGENMKDISFV